jgi:hypothetical protein
MSECHNILTFFFVPLFGIKCERMGKQLIVRQVCTNDNTAVVILKKGNNGKIEYQTTWRQGSC